MLLDPLAYCDEELFDDTYLPEQHYLPLSPDDGEHRLYYAVLKDAVDCYYRGLGHPSREQWRAHCEARDWFASPEEQYPFSFLAICSALRIEPGHFRRGLAQLTVASHVPHLHQKTTKRRRQRA